MEVILARGAMVGVGGEAFEGVRLAPFAGLYLCVKPCDTVLCLADAPLEVRQPLSLAGLLVNGSLPLLQLGHLGLQSCELGFACSDCIVVVRGVLGVDVLHPDHGSVYGGWIGLEGLCGWLGSSTGMEGG